ncbi:MAG: Uma2 family endonuclease [Jaaginema sp. PMC 1079.18]|nr:Uma2 family endonuclease [Jaaginema sp. PMC 1080.18]MEC4853805.1 Uma2 family endonuclease [Jaaginema sp. PMC 1079.18]MEC4867345.1 Uma2 family endonuclease [Jaaginema sp. PMC 1078.18]
MTKWSVVDYQQMRKLGILNHHRCELIKGVIWDMSPEGELHRFVNHRGVKYLRSILNQKAEVFEAHPITLADSEPQPDIAVVRLPDTRYLQHHPYPEDIFWLIEVADTTFAYDMDTKRQLYAQVSIPEYWVVDVRKKQLIVFRDLENNEFSTQTTMSEGVIYPGAFPDVAVVVQQLVDIPAE